MHFILWRSIFLKNKNDDISMSNEVIQKSLEIKHKNEFEDVFKKAMEK